jgi:hypothetical protein
MRPVEFIIKEGDEHLTSHSGLALIGALMDRMELWAIINAVTLPGCREPKIPHSDKETSQEGKTVWRGATHRIPDGFTDPLRVVFEVNKRTMKDDQYLLVPEVDTYWTSLEDDPYPVILLHQDHGTCEQFHYSLRREHVREVTGFTGCIDFNTMNQDIHLVHCTAP